MREKFFLALLETQKAHWELSRKGFQKLELTDGQPKILYILLRREGCVQKDLAEVCRIRPSTLTVDGKAGVYLQRGTEAAGREACLWNFFNRERTEESGAVGCFYRNAGRKKPGGIFGRRAGRALFLPGKDSGKFGRTARS